mmetsp:Transcript_43794/g.70392  ORF Transcript_43794/g.70392 Transcript_43794/m.70392 type:complete len:226 (+) Transcript_43794:1178-1855(+)
MSLMAIGISSRASSPRECLCFRTSSTMHFRIFSSSPSSSERFSSVKASTTRLLAHFLCSGATTCLCRTDSTLTLNLGAFRFIFRLQFGQRNTFFVFTTPVSDDGRFCSTLKAAIELIRLRTENCDIGPTFEVSFLSRFLLDPFIEVFDNVAGPEPAESFRKRRIFSMVPPRPSLVSSSMSISILEHQRKYRVRFRFLKCSTNRFKRVPLPRETWDICRTKSSAAV